MSRIIGASLRFRLLVVGIAAGVLAVGVAQLRNAPVDVLPEFTPAYVEIQTEALGLSAEEVEQLITVPLEADLLNGVQGVDVIRSGPELVLRGAKERLAPILMTALATGLALVPLAIAGSIPGHEIEHPMAIVILGGLVTSTLLNLFVLPSLYLRFGRARS